MQSNLFFIYFLLLLDPTWAYGIEIVAFYFIGAEIPPSIMAELHLNLCYITHGSEKTSNSLAFWTMVVQIQAQMSNVKSQHLPNAQSKPNYASPNGKLEAQLQNLPLTQKKIISNLTKEKAQWQMPTLGIGAKFACGPS